MLRLMSMRRLAGCLLGASLAVACGGVESQSASQAQPASQTQTASHGRPAFQTSDFLGIWNGPSGEPAERGASQDRTFELSTMRMPDHCDWQEAVVLQVAWPLGTTYANGPDAPDAPDVREFMRDPQGVLPHRPGAYRSKLDLDSDLPEDATPNGYSIGGVELWFGPDGGEEFAYLVRAGRSERWPREYEEVACA